MTEENKIVVKSNRGRPRHVEFTPLSVYGTRLELASPAVVANQHLVSVINQALQALVDLHQITSDDKLNVACSELRLWDGAVATVNLPVELNIKQHGEGGA